MRNRPGWASSRAASVSFSSISPTTVQVHHRANASRIHLGKVTLDPLRRERRLTAAKMVVNVDDREGRSGDIGRFCDQHRPRLPVAEFQFLDVVLLLGQ